MLIFQQYVVSPWMSVPVEGSSCAGIMTSTDRNVSSFPTEDAGEITTGAQILTSKPHLIDIMCVDPTLIWCQIDGYDVILMLRWHWLLYLSSCQRRLRIYVLSLHSRRKNSISRYTFRFMMIFCWVEDISAKHYLELIVKILLNSPLAQSGRCVSIRWCFRSKSE